MTSPSQSACHTLPAIMIGSQMAHFQRQSNQSPLRFSCESSVSGWASVSSSLYSQYIEEFLVHSGPSISIFLNYLIPWLFFELWRNMSVAVPDTWEDSEARAAIMEPETEPAGHKPRGETHDYIMRALKPELPLGFSSTRANKFLFCIVHVWLGLCHCWLTKS